MRLTSRQVWRVLVPVVCLVAGFGFAASARDSRGTDLRPPGTANLRDLVRSAEAKVRAQDSELAALQRQVTSATRGPGAPTATSPLCSSRRPPCSSRAG